MYIYNVQINDLPCETFKTLTPWTHSFQSYKRDCMGLSPQPRTQAFARPLFDILLTRRSRLQHIKKAESPGNDVAVTTASIDVKCLGGKVNLSNYNNCAALSKYSVF